MTSKYLMIVFWISSLTVSSLNCLCPIWPVLSASNVTYTRDKVCMFALYVINSRARLPNSLSRKPPWPNCRSVMPADRRMPSHSPSSGFVVMSALLSTRWTTVPDSPSVITAT